MFRKSLINLLLFMLYVAFADDTKGHSGDSRNGIDSLQASVIISLLNNAKNLIDDAKTYAAYKTNYTSNELLCDKLMDCAEILEKYRGAKSSVYKIWPRSRIVKGPINVYCDMEDNGGAWTIIQRRGDFRKEADYFYKEWNEYKVGFGDPQEDHWIGNDIIFALTNQRSNVVKFILSDWEGNTTHAEYREFWIEDESRKYTMHVSGYSGTAGDSFGSTNKAQFTTKDQDNDSYGENCAVSFKGAWWYTKCHSSNLNGMYLKGAHESRADGVNWKPFRGHYYSLKDTVIKIRPKDFTQNKLNNHKSDNPKSDNPKSDNSKSDNHKSDNTPR